ncbi:hypothetical protein PG984_005338 [Apiospora sp. TS-2023a]
MENENASNGTSVLHSEAQKVRAVLHRYISYILSHPAVLQAPPHVRHQLHKQLASCMVAHLDHQEGSRWFREQHQQQEQEQRQKHTPSHGSAAPVAPAFKSTQHPTYHAWVQEVGAKKIEAPWVFLFFGCLASQSPGGEPFFVGARQTYLANALSQHLAAYCRQYNDYGSVARDRAEGNLNSLDFPEFAEEDDDVGLILKLQQYQGQDDARKKADLLAIADIERECVDHVMGMLCEELRRGRKGDGKIRALKAYVDTVELYRQIYVVRDISKQKMR